MVPTKSATWSTDQDWYFSVDFADKSKGEFIFVWVKLVVEFDFVGVVEPVVDSSSSSSTEIGGLKLDGGGCKSFESLVRIPVSSESLVRNPVENGSEIVCGETDAKAWAAAASCRWRLMRNKCWWKSAQESAVDGIEGCCGGIAEGWSLKLTDKLDRIQLTLKCLQADLRDKTRFLG